MKKTEKAAATEVESEAERDAAGTAVWGSVVVVGWETEGAEGRGAQAGAGGGVAEVAEVVVVSAAEAAG